MRRTVVALAALVMLSAAPACAGQITNSSGANCTLVHVNTTTVGNVGGGEDDLMTYALPANSMSANGSVIDIRALFSFAANGNTKTPRLYFGATELSYSAGLTGSNVGGFFAATVVRTSAAAQFAVFEGAVGATGFDGTQTTPTENTAAAITIKLTGQSASSATDDIVQRALIVRMCTP